MTADKEKNPAAVALGHLGGIIRWNPTIDQCDIMTKEQKAAAASALGKLGARKGARILADKLGVIGRRERAANAAKERWRRVAEQNLLTQA
jgi:hypothetical protein